MNPVSYLTIDKNQRSQRQLPPLSSVPSKSSFKTLNPDSSSTTRNEVRVKTNLRNASQQKLKTIRNMQNNVTILNKSSKIGTHQQKRYSTKLENYSSIKIKNKTSLQEEQPDYEDKVYKNRYIDDIPMYLTACLQEDIPLDSGNLDPHAFDRQLYCQSVNHLIG